MDNDDDVVSEAGQGLAANTDPIEIARTVDAFFEEATWSRYSAGGPGQGISEALRAYEPFQLAPFVEAYQAGAVFPADRLVNVLLGFTDVRLALEYLMIDFGLSNEYYYSPVHRNPALKDSPNLLLKLMSFDQSIIGRSRIAWEKLMRTIFYLDTGKELRPSGKRKSYKAAFFAWVEEHDKWCFLDSYKDVVTEHDAKLRTPEFHKNSVLRARIFGTNKVDPNEIVVLSNAMRNVWPAIVDTVRGEKPRETWLTGCPPTSGQASI